ncbi:MAG: inositol monophosphatase family protein [Alphaproteobacteria bacterium]
MSIKSTTISIMIQAAEAAGRKLIRDFGELEHLQISSKAPGDFVTKADQKSEDVIRSHLEKSRPNYGFILEEGGIVEGSDTSNNWIIDPLDGTHNFMHGLPFFAISIGLVRDGKPYAGVIFNPISNQMWLAEKGQGAWMHNRRLRVSRKKVLSETLNYTEMPRMHHASRERALKRITVLSRLGGQTRDLGSAALGLAYFASGQFDSIFLENIHAWDIAAGIIIAKEAGGLIRDFEGEQNMLEKGEVIGTNGIIDNDLRKVLEKFDMKLPHYE